MDVTAIGAILSSPALAALGPSAPVIVCMLIMLWFWSRGREERQAKINEEVAKNFREDWRKMYDDVVRDRDGLRAENTALKAQISEIEVRASRYRTQRSDFYMLARDNGHSAASARALLLAANLKTADDYRHSPIRVPELPAD